MKLTSQNLAEIVSVIASVPNGKSLPAVKGLFLRSKIIYGTGFLNAIAADGGNTILDNQVRSVGVTNLQGSRPAKGKVFVIKGVRVLFDTTTGIQAAGIKTAKWESKAPSNFLNGEITISQSGQGDLVTLTGSVICNNKIAQSNADDFVEISPIVMRSEAEMSQIILLASAGSVDQAFKYEWDCVEIVEAGKE